MKKKGKDIKKTEKKNTAKKDDSVKKVAEKKEDKKQIKMITGSLAIFFAIIALVMFIHNEGESEIRAYEITNQNFFCVTGEDMFVTIGDSEEFYRECSLRKGDTFNLDLEKHMIFGAQIQTNGCNDKSDYEFIFGKEEGKVITVTLKEMREDTCNDFGLTQKFVALDKKYEDYEFKYIKQ